MIKSIRRTPQERQDLIKEEDGPKKRGLIQVEKRF